MFKAYKKLEKEFKNKNTFKITTRNIEYDEIYNIQYEINTELERNNLLSSDLKPDKLGDEIERQNILNYFFNQINLFKFDKSTRQAVFTPEYQDVVGLNACLSLFQIIYRNSKLDLHVFVRSQHFDNNFLYDNQTYCQLIETMANKLNVKVGTIFVKITSLHKEHERRSS